MAEDSIVSVYVTFPNADVAKDIAKQMVTARLAACANVLTAPAVSIYEWNGTMAEENEVIAFFKLPQAGFDAFAARMRALHPYETPCIIAIPLVAGDDTYFDWVRAQTQV